MGSFALVPNKSQTIMKVLLLVALAIAAVVAEPEAEADSAFVHHGGRYYGHPWGGYYAVASVATNENRIHGDFVPKAIVPPPATHVVGKRDAEDAKAKPTLIYPGLYGHPLAVPTVVKGEPFAGTVDPKAVVPYVAHPGYPYAGVLGATHYVVKREAEAEAEAEPEADAWYGHYYGHPWGGYYGYPYRYGYYGYGHRYWW